MKTQTVFVAVALAGTGTWILLALSSLVSARWGRRLRRSSRSWEGSLALGGAVGVLGLSCTYFGAFGLALGDSLAVSQTLLVAAAGALAASWATRTAIRAYFRPVADQAPVGSSNLSGACGHVSLPIPREGVGAVALLLEGRRVTRPARSAEGEPLSLRTQVQVVAAHGGTVTVRPSARELS